MTTPTREMQQGRQDTRMAESMSELRGVVDAASVVPRQAVRESRDAVDDRLKKYWWPRIIGACALAAIFAAVGAAYVTSYVFNDRLGGAVADQALRDAAQDAAAESLRSRTAQYSAAGEQANDVLRARGQNPVDLPAPGTVPDSEIITKSIVSQVLAQLPPTATGLTADQVGKQIASFIAANPQAVPGANADPATIATQVASYISANVEQLRGPGGEQGDAGIPGGPGSNGTDGANGTNGTDGQNGGQGPQGAPGPPPTAEQIMAAFTDTVRANPNLLCPLGGSYARSELLASDGRSIVINFGCAEPGGTTSPPDTGEPTPTTEPPPPDTGEPGDGNQVQPTATDDPAEPPATDAPPALDETGAPTP